MSSPAPQRRIVWQHPQAPAKPNFGADCNGCGLCCLVEPCPLGMLATRRRHGACALLRWSGSQQRYVCGAISNAPSDWLGRLRQRLAVRWIAAGKGCDADWEDERD